MLAFLRSAFLQAPDGRHASPDAPAFMRGAFLVLGIVRVDAVFRKLGFSKWTWLIDVASADPALDLKSVPSLLTSHFWCCLPRV